MTGTRRMHMDCTRERCLLGDPSPCGLFGQDPPAPQPQWLTVAEVAAEVRVSRMTVYRMVHSGELRSVRVGRGFRIPRDAWEQYLRDESRSG